MTKPNLTQLIEEVKSLSGIVAGIEASEEEPYYIAGFEKACDLILEKLGLTIHICTDVVCKHGLRKYVNPPKRLLTYSKETNRI